MRCLPPVGGRRPLHGQPGRVSRMWRGARRRATSAGPSREQGAHDHPPCRMESMNISQTECDLRHVSRKMVSTNSRYRHSELLKLGHQKPRVPFGLNEPFAAQITSQSEEKFKIS